MRGITEKVSKLISGCRTFNYCNHPLIPSKCHDGHSPWRAIAISIAITIDISIRTANAMESHSHSYADQ